MKGSFKGDGPDYRDEGESAGARPHRFPGFLAPLPNGSLRPARSFGHALRPRPGGALRRAKRVNQSPAGQPEQLGHLAAGTGPPRGLPPQFVHHREAMVNEAAPPSRR